MARNKAPWFKFFADQYIIDPAIQAMSLEERGICQTLYAYMWMNTVKRGHLLLDRDTPIPDEQIATKMLGISLTHWKQVNSSLVFKKKIKQGKKKQWYSPWLCKQKTKYELYGKQKEK